MKYALDKPKLKRLYYSHLKVDSPYNTYLHKGLLPGPICIPDPRVIDAVLNYESHNFILCVLLSHLILDNNFSSTNLEHEKFKKIYTNWLAAEGINNPTIKHKRLDKKQVKATLSIDHLNFLNLFHFLQNINV